MRVIYIKFQVLLVAWANILGCTPEEKNAFQTIKERQQTGDLVVRFARLEINADSLEEYLSFLREGIETSVKTEPGVLTMYALQEQDEPTKITVLEVYASESAYQSHLATAHFQKYKNGTLKW